MLKLVNVVAQLRVKGARLEALLEGRYPKHGRRKGLSLIHI